MIKLVGFDSAVEGILQKIIDGKNIETGDKEVEVVWAEMAAGNRQALRGLDYAMDQARNPNKAIVLSSMMGDYIANDGRFQAAMGYPNVSYCAMISLTKDIDAKVAEAVEGKRPKDELAIDLASEKMEQTMLARLKHDMKYAVEEAEGSAKRTEWISNAQKLFGLPAEATMDELVEKVTNTEKVGVESKFVGKELPGVFVDVEGTLLVKDEGGNEVVNMPLVEKLQERAKISPITIWTDTKIDYIKGPLRNAGILWKIVPKEYFKGCVPEEVVDDLSEAEFEAKYEIKPKKFTSPADFISGEEKPLVEKDAMSEAPVVAEPAQDEAAPAQIPSAPGTSI